MTEQEAFEAWFAEYRKTVAITRDADIWHAALAWLRSQGEPVLWMLEDEDGDREFNGVDKFSCGRTGGVPLFLAPQPAIPDGWKLVPKEIAAVLQAIIDDFDDGRGYTNLDDELADRARAALVLLAAAPEPSK